MCVCYPHSSQLVVSKTVKRGIHFMEKLVEKLSRLKLAEITVLQLNGTKLMARLLKREEHYLFIYITPQVGFPYSTQGHVRPVAVAKIDCMEH